MAKVFRSVAEWRTFRTHSLHHVKSIGFVPTMGCLHEGHRTLLKKSVAENDFTILSIFVNKTQFTDTSDYENYTSTTQEDLQIANAEKVDAVLIPTYEQMYPDRFHYKVSEDVISLVREGQYRPGHFDGVLTVVLKFLQLVKPHKAYLGEKDYQQYELIRGMKKAFFVDTEIILCPVVRDENGIALSSRNRRLTKEQLKLVEHFPRLLSSKTLTDEQVKAELEALGFYINYVEEANGRRYGSVKIGNVFLIDNFLLR